MRRKTKKTAKKKTERREYLRLTDEERQLIVYRRETGTLPKEHLVSADGNALKTKKTLREAKKRYNHLREDNEKLREQINYFNLHSDKRIQIKAKSRTGNEGTAIALASDWHIEERIDPQTINGRNEFNPKIAKKRVKQFFQKSLSWTNTARNNSKIDNFVLAILGDIISGYIHEELVENNYFSPTESILYATELICSGIDFLLDEGKFQNIIIPCCCGNHGRTTKKSRIGTMTKNSYEWMMYHNIAKIYKNNSKVKFIIPPSYHAIVPIYKFPVRFHHGDWMRYYGGVGGLTIPVNKSIAQWNKEQSVYLDAFGHFHQRLDGGNFVSNGSLIGWGAFAVYVKAAYEPPCQQFFVIDKERGKTMVAPIYLD